MARAEKAITYHPLVNNFNVNKGREIYLHFCKNGLTYHQYIECVEFDSNGRPLPHTVSAEEWGRVLCEIFDEWIQSDTRRVSIRLFDSIIGCLVDGSRNLCQINDNCCQYFVVERNGDLYPCDFFVEDKLKLGNIHTSSWHQLQNSAQYQVFGSQKKTMNQKCLDCEYCFLCQGDCIKNRSAGLMAHQSKSWLCKGWRMFYQHTLPEFRKLADQIKQETPKICQVLYRKLQSKQRYENCNNATLSLSLSPLFSAH